ncbi:hypothetical protein Q4503_17225 [Colwellia sp. 6_MG-2023]|uniref:hypothetical protein n=1 Tax=Colwellia sp. 6_MG-2023 TaxID=3062676 RepID=UPI0026E3E210|nr:hypothetical protein [Colwellia sp. 6_MG-2023]MDO6489440.1 hypothetical protein [Colwellia sp. 6_MG-2023]
MSEQLPISISVCNDLVQQFTKIRSVCNKLEAQFNFQTMTANWYGNEEAVLSVKLFIETASSFTIHKQAQAQSEIKHYSDDVFSYYNNSEKNQTLSCYIAITDSEFSMLNQQHKILAGLLHIKLQKVLNLVAKQLTLDTI